MPRRNAPKKQETDIDVDEREERDEREQEAPSAEYAAFLPPSLPVAAHNERYGHPSPEDVVVERDERQALDDPAERYDPERGYVVSAGAERA